MCWNVSDKKFIELIFISKVFDIFKISKAMSVIFKFIFSRWPCLETLKG